MPVLPCHYIADCKSMTRLTLPQRHAFKKSMSFFTGSNIIFPATTRYFYRYLSMYYRAPSHALPAHEEDMAARSRRIKRVMP